MYSLTVQTHYLMLKCKCMDTVVCKAMVLIPVVMATVEWVAMAEWVAMEEWVDMDPLAII